MSTHRADRKPGVEEIEADIARTREELADTVDALTARLDVKARTQDRIRNLNGVAVAGVLATIVAASAVLVIWRRRR